jgi:hypothetical protein
MLRPLNGAADTLGDGVDGAISGGRRTTHSLARTNSGELWMELEQKVKQSGAAAEAEAAQHDEGADGHPGHGRGDKAEVRGFGRARV